MGNKSAKLNKRSLSEANTSEPAKPQGQVKQRSRSIVTVPTDSTENLGLGMRRASTARKACMPSSDTPTLSITNIERTMVHQAWRTLQQQRRSFAAGQDTFQFLCFRYPEIKRAFAWDELTCGLSEIRQAEQTKLHSIAFMNLVNEVMANLHDLPTVIPIIMELGRLHARYKRHGFCPAHLDQLSEVAITKSTDWVDRRHKCPDFNQGWAAIVAFIIRCLKEGYYQEIRKMRRESRASFTASNVDLKMLTNSNLDLRDNLGRRGSFNRQGSTKSTNSSEGKSGVPKPSDILVEESETPETSTADGLLESPAKQSTPAPGPAAGTLERKSKQSDTTVTLAPVLPGNSASNSSNGITVKTVSFEDCVEDRPKNQNQPSPRKVMQTDL